MINEYFSHDYDASNDPKLSALIGMYKAEGYGIYWRIIEMLHKEGGYLILNQVTYSAIGRSIEADAETVKKIIQDGISVFELFKEKSGKFTSVRALKNLKQRLKVKADKSKAGKASAEKRKLAAIVQHIPTPVEQDSTKEKKEKEIKEKDIVIVPPPVVKEMSQQDFQLFQTQLIQDDMFIEPLMMTKRIKDKQTLLNWIKVFNVHIAGESKTQKDYVEYKRHFKNWIVKQNTTVPPEVIAPTGERKESAREKRDRELLNEIHGPNTAQ